MKLGACATVCSLEPATVTEVMERVSTEAKPTTGSRVAQAFGLEGDNWMRHANPLSVWTRFSVLSLFAISIWSRDWIGWLCLIPIALSIAWMFVNPLLFKEPRSTRSWASRAVFGERIWVDRDKLELPEEFRSAAVPNIANAFGGIGLIFLAYGLYELDIVVTVAGILIVHGGKLWYLDRMTLLFDRMKGRSATYAAWEY